MKNRDPRDILVDRRDEIWEDAVSRASSWRPLTLSDHSRGVRSLYLALAEFVKTHNVRPYAFELDYRRIAAMIDRSLAATWERVCRAEDAGVLIRHHHGFADEVIDGKRARGKSTFFGLVGDGETVEEIRRFGLADPRVQERLAEAEKRDLLNYADRTIGAAAGRQQRGKRSDWPEAS